MKTITIKMSNFYIIMGGLVLSFVLSVYSILNRPNCSNEILSLTPKSWNATNSYKFENGKHVLTFWDKTKDKELQLYPDTKYRR